MDSVETRKVQVTGGTTLIVSLPKTWANKVNLKGGDQVSLVPQSDGSLCVRTRSVSEENLSKSIFIEGKEGEILSRELIGVYIAGYNSIELRAEKILSKQRETVRRTVNMLIGPEIIEETLDKIVLQDVLNPAELSVKKSIKRMHMITSSMQENAITALKEKDFDLAKDVGARDSEVDKLFLLVSKQFRMVMRDISLADKFSMSMEEHLDLTLCASPLERIGDHAAKMCQMVEQIGYRSVPEEVVANIDEANRLSLKIVADAMDALFKRNLETAHSTFAARRAATESLQKIDEDLLGMSSDISVPLGIVIDSIDRVCDYGCNIAEIAINSTVSSR